MLDLEVVEADLVRIQYECYGKVQEEFCVLFLKFEILDEDLNL